MKKDCLGHLIAALFRRDKNKHPMAQTRAERLLSAVRLCLKPSPHDISERKGNLTP